MGRHRKGSFSSRGGFVALWLGAGSLAACSGALTPGAPSDDAAIEASDAASPPVCPAPADIHNGTPCDYVGPACPSLESPWPPACGDRGGPRAPCICHDQQWACSQLEIACFDAGPPVEDARADAVSPVDAKPPVDAPPCPPPDQVRNNGACAPSFLSCPSVENKIPACVGGYEPTTCHCLTAQWSCEFYGIPCPDAGPSFDGEGTDAGPIVREARADEPVPIACDGPSCTDAAADSSADAIEEPSPE